MEPITVCAIETSSQTAEAALLEPDGRCHTVLCEAKLAHSRELFPKLFDLFASRNLGPGDMDLFAVDNGPGSYTGIRVGVTAAKTLAFALRKPVVAVNSLRVLISNLPGGEASPAVPIVDAKLGQVYAAVYKFTPKPEPLLRDFVGTPEKLIQEIPKEAVLFGDGFERYRQEFSRFNAGDPKWALPHAREVAILGKRTFLSQGGVDPHGLVPNYLGIPEAERKLKEKKRHGK